MSIDRWLDKDIYIYIYIYIYTHTHTERTTELNWYTHTHTHTHKHTMGYDSARKQNEIMPFAATWMNLEIIILSEISQIKKDKYHVMSLICRIEVQFSSVAQSCPTLCDPTDCSTPGLPIHHQLPEFTQTHVIKSVMPFNHLIFCHPLLLPPSICQH